jgi:hypothetical protein
MPIFKITYAGSRGRFRVPTFILMIYGSVIQKIFYGDIHEKLHLENPLRSIDRAGIIPENIA